MRLQVQFLLPIGLLLALSAACGDDECTRSCPPGQACVLDSGQELCLEANCGGQACSPGTTCVNNACVVDQTCTGCTSSEHCVSGNCIANYSGTNVCDPLRQCRRACGTSARCLDACDTDRSNTCSECLDVLATCETNGNCDSGAVNSCCETQFCDCFPFAPGCGNVQDCLECQQDCDDDVTCFNRCRQADLACNLCMQPFDQCRTDNGGSAAACTSEFCDCLDPALEEGCQ